MKRYLLIFSFVFALFPILAQDISGKWGGNLQITPVVNLKVVFNINKIDSGYSATMDSPDQEAFGLPVSSVTFESNVLTIKASGIGVSYVGNYTPGDSIAGEFQQGGAKFPLQLKKESLTQKPVSRPQEPKGPFPYVSEEVKFENTAAGVTLAGTLTLPQKEGKFPAVIMITGSGAQNRDEAIFGHKPFFVIADFLTRKGIAVLRYDDRGTAGSTGDFSKATTIDFASDVSAALDYMNTRPEINYKKIGLCGHSEGGVIAPMVASTRKDVDFIVLLAGTGMRGNELLLLQQEMIGKALGMTAENLEKPHNFNKGAFEIVLNGGYDDATESKLKDYIRKLVIESPVNEKTGKSTDDETVAQTLKQLFNPWMVFFIKYDPKPTLEKVRCPVLALNGSNDLQVPAKENLTAIKTALDKGGNRKVTVREYPGLNHLFQNCKTGSPLEYGKIEETISPQVLDDISAWILKQVK